jgi:hypothetical protein
MTQQSQIRLGEEMMAFEIDTSTAFGLAVATRFDKHSNTMPIRVTPKNTAVDKTRQVAAHFRIDTGLSGPVRDSHKNFTPWRRET